MYLIKLKGIISYPVYGGDSFLFDLTVYDTTGVVMSWSEWTKVEYESLVSSTTYKSIFYNSGHTQHSVIKTVNGILVVQFQTVKAVPEGRWKTKPTDLMGLLEIEIQGTYLDENLGVTGAVDRDLIPCRAVLGLVPISGYSIEC